MTSIQHAREALGGRLRELRRGSGLTGRQLAESLAWAPSKVSKLENGRQTPTDDDVCGWCSACGPGGEREQDALLASLHTLESRHAEWRRILSAGATGHQVEISALDAKTRLFRAFETSIVPGLLQVDGYARAVFAKVIATHGVRNDINEAVARRMARQQILYDPAKRFHFVIAEAALRYRLCPTEVMLAQMDRLMAATALSRVRIGVIANQTTYATIPSHGFWILDDQLVMIETISAELNLAQPQEIDLYTGAFGQLAAIADYGSGARAILTGIIEELRAEVTEDDDGISDTLPTQLSGHETAPDDASDFGTTSRLDEFRETLRIFLAPWLRSMSGWIMSVNSALSPRPWTPGTSRSAEKRDVLRAGDRAA